MSPDPRALTRGRSLRGNVDRNCLIGFSSPRSIVVPYVGTWIEMILNKLLLSPSRRSRRGNVDRNVRMSRRPGIGMEVVPYVGTWIEIA